jgi:hypothetical protein
MGGAHARAATGKQPAANSSCAGALLLPLPHTASPVSLLQTLSLSLFLSLSLSLSLSRPDAPPPYVHPRMADGCACGWRAQVAPGDAATAARASGLVPSQVAPPAGPSLAEMMQGSLDAAMGR